MTGWVLGSSPLFLGMCGRLGAPTLELCPWVSSSWIAAVLGVLWERSLFLNSHSGLEGADSEPWEQLTAALSHSPSRPSPYSLAHKGPWACGLSSGGGSGRAGPGLVVGMSCRSSFRFSLALFVYQRLTAPCPVALPRPQRGPRGSARGSWFVTSPVTSKLVVEQSD